MNLIDDSEYGSVQFLFFTISFLDIYPFILSALTHLIGTQVYVNALTFGKLETGSANTTMHQFIGLF
jgi:hypothetical protein